MAQSTQPEAETYLWHEGGIRTHWNGLRKDVDLWDASGDCLVYLYTHGTSQRPASIRVPLDTLHSASCSPLLISSTSTSPSVPDSVVREIFVGAPKNLTREESFAWHVTTRNFFAWLVGKPIVGAQLGVALSQLLERMGQYRSGNTNNVQDLLAFARRLGYSQLAHRSENAVAMLVLAERHQMRSEWINAFSHCVAMSDVIHDAPDYVALSKVNKALITKAALQMDIGLEAKTRSVSNLLEYELSIATPGFSQAGVNHLEYLRSVLQSRLVARYGYWPPRTEAFSKQLHASLCKDFDCLYQYLGDFDGSRAGPDHNNTTLERFDSEHGYPRLTASRPLVPQSLSSPSRRASSASLSGLTWRKSVRAPSISAIQAAHQSATNRGKPNVLQNYLVQAYVNFEDENAAAMHQNVSFEEARNVAWALVYGMLQTLRAMMHAAPEVTEVDDAAYPLCCSTSELPPWTTGSVLPALASFEPSRGSHGDARASVTEVMASKSDLPARQSSVTSVSDAASVSRMQRMRPLRTKSLRESFALSRPSRLTPAFSTSSLVSTAAPEQTIYETIETADERGTFFESDHEASTPESEVPSLDWSRGSRKSTSSVSDSDEGTSPVFSSPSHFHTSSKTSNNSEGDPVIPGRTSSFLRPKERSLSRSSSVYSERAPAIPRKVPGRVDIVDKGLAGDQDFVVPGLW